MRESRVYSDAIRVKTKGDPDVLDLTDRLRSIIRDSGIQDGLACVIVAGSTAALTTIEYESGVVNDLTRAVAKLAPRDQAYEHDRRWGDGNGYAHVRAALVGPSLTIPIQGGQLILGTWQQVVLLDFDNRPRQRDVQVQLVGA